MTRELAWRSFATGAACSMALSLATVPSYGAIAEYSTRASFAAAVLQSATDTFDDIDSQFVPTPLARPMGRFTYTIGVTAGGQGDLAYGLPSAPTSAPATWLTTNAADSVVTFSGFARGVNAVGAAFFLTTFLGDVWLYSNASLTVTAVYSGDSVSEVVSQTADTSFLGFVADDQLLSLTVMAQRPAGDGPYWSTVSGLTLASLSTVAVTPVPEASSATLVGAGLLAVWMHRRRRSGGAS